MQILQSTIYVLYWTSHIPIMDTRTGAVTIILTGVEPFLILHNFCDFPRHLIGCRKNWFSLRDWLTMLFNYRTTQFQYCHCPGRGNGINVIMGTSVQYKSHIFVVLCMVGLSSVNRRKSQQLGFDLM